MDNVRIYKLTPRFNDHSIWCKIGDKQMLQSGKEFGDYRIFPYCIYKDYAILIDFYDDSIIIIDSNGYNVNAKFLNTPIIIFNCYEFTEEMYFEIDNYIYNLLNSSNNDR